MPPPPPHAAARPDVDPVLDPHDLDRLTSLPTRTAALRLLNATLASAASHGETVAVVCLDLDGLNTINEMQGLTAGDAYLVAIADRALAITGDRLLTARLDGDEFLIVRPAVGGLGDAVALAARITESVETTVEIVGRPVRCRVSQGIALYPEDGADAETLLRHARLALAVARDDRRHGLRFFLPEMSERRRRVQWVEAELRVAFATGQLALHYQPQLDLASGRIVAVESLMRWRHPEQGWISPAEFIPAAERSGLIVEIGRWALLEACRQGMRWTALGHPGIEVAVNVSPLQVAFPEIRDEVRDALAASGLPATRLCIEVTEGIFMADRAAVGRALESLTQLGVRLSVDDFGSGYASLGYLKDFTLDQLKLDASIVHGLDRDPRTRAIVEAVVKLGHDLGLQIIAEGIETPQELVSLKGLGCDSVQGYIVAKPMPAEECAAFFARHFDDLMADAEQAAARFREPARSFTTTRLPLPPEAMPAG